MWYFITRQNGTSEITERSTRPDMQAESLTMSSGPFDTRQQCIDSNGIQDKPCVKCGQPVAAHFCEPVQSQILEKNMCFDCNFWDERSKVIQYNNMICDGQWYTVRPEEEKSYFRGFGGREFTFMKDGRIINSTNVWFGGDIPKHFRDVLPDNATLITPNKVFETVEL